jgi:hypothetical protein
VENVAQIVGLPVKFKKIGEKSPNLVALETIILVAYKTSYSGISYSEKPTSDQNPLFSAVFDPMTFLCPELEVVES